MSWKERVLYLVLMIGVYSIGRWQSENRELLNRALRAKEFSKALKENRIGDIEYRLQDDINVCTYNSYTAFSFGPDLWQKPLPQEKISFALNAEENSTTSSPKTVDSTHAPQTPSKPKTTFISETPASSSSEPQNTKEEASAEKAEAPATPPPEESPSESKPASTPE